MEQVAKKQEKKTGKVGAFFDKYYALFFAPVLVAFLYIFMLWQHDVYPFGNTYTAASYDLSAQIAPFIEHLFDVFDGKSTLTFSYAIVGGADVTGTFLYFFVSPFSFLFLIFGDGKVAHAGSVVMLCKLMTISVAGAWFAKTQFKGIPDYLCIAVGVVYAYCGYTFVSNTYINWTDFLIYMPFCVGGFKKFVKTGKFLTFSVLVACCIYTCFSIACFSLFTVFPALVAYGLLCVEKPKRTRFVADVCLSLAVAIFMALPVLLPALGAYSVSGRGGSLFENLWKGFTVNGSTGLPEKFNAQTFKNAWEESLYRKWSYIVSDSIFVFLTLIWFYRKGFKDKFAQFMLVAGGLTLLPLLVDESMNLLNMGSYMSYALRFGFLNALYFLGGACLCLENLCYAPLCAYDGKPLLKKEPSPAVSEGKEGGRVALKAFLRRENRSALAFSCGLTGLTLLLAGFLLWFISGENFLKLLKALGSDSGGFSGSFAHSLGGLEVVVIPFVVVGVLTLVGSFLLAERKVSLRLVSVLLLVVVGIQVVFYNNHLVLGNRSTQHEKMGGYQQLNQMLNERTEGYFRVKDYDDELTATAPFTGGANSFSVFSSVIDKDNFVTMRLFDYKGNGKNTFKSAHNTSTNRAVEFGDSFLGYRYAISKKNDLNKVNYKPVYALDEQGNPLVDGEGKKVQLAKNGLYVYENTMTFPIGFKVGAEGFRFVEKNDNNARHRLLNQNALYEYLRGKPLNTDWVSSTKTKELSAHLQTKAADVEVSAGKISARVKAEKGESLLLSFVAVKGYSVTVNGKKAELIDNDLKFLQVALEEGENEVTFTYSSPYMKYGIVGFVGGALLLCIVALVLKKTRLMEKAAPVLFWAGIAVSVAVVAFFMVFPTGVFLSKLIWWVK